MAKKKKKKKKQAFQIPDKFYAVKEGGYVVKNTPTTVQATKIINFLLGNGGEPACLFEILEFEI